nr:YdbH domain-containing protein [Sphingomonas jinjuensis]
MWIERRPIASRFIDDTLAAKGVPARYRIEALAPGRQRLTNVVIGDPARPDLVADWIETRTGFGFDGPRLVGVRAGRVRVSARLVDGRVSLGSLDRLMGPPSGKPFTLPALDVAIEEARIALATPYGAARIAVSGAGRLDDGFSGRARLSTPRLVVGGCSLAQTSGELRLWVDARRPHVMGPVRADAVACDGVAVTRPAATIELGFSESLADWSGHARIGTGRVATAAVTAASLAGQVTLDGSGKGGGGRVALTARALSRPSLTAAAAAATVSGDYRYGQAPGFAGRVVVQQARAASVPRIAAPGTPLAPLAEALSRAVAAAGRDLDGEAALVVDRAGMIVRDVAVTAASGAVARLSGRGIGYGWQRGLASVDGVLAVSGGGLPGVEASVARTPAGVLTGTARVARYAAGDASLALAPIAFRLDGDRGRFETVALVSGPLGNGRIDGLRLPLTIERRGGVLAINPGCTPLAWTRLAMSGLVLDPTTLTLCPTGGTLVRVDGTGVDGGARLAATRLAGRIGATPLAVTLKGGGVRLGDRGFALSGVEARLGRPESLTVITAATLDGRLTERGVAGRFAGGGGRIGAVPLRLSKAAGDWRFADGALTLGGTLAVADTATPARFNPLNGRDVTLTLAGNVIRATGTLIAPDTDVRVADVGIEQRLASGTGSADLTVPGITFAKAFQPDRLTPITFGVIADVRGTVSGSGRIAWGPGGVTSTGTFTTQGMDLAAAFGPVTGLSGTIRFTDLLALESAPGQVATVASINPGIAVTDGRVVYQTLPGTRVRVEGARWPFAGGSLTLDPTLLDFSSAEARRLTFRVTGAAADQFLQQFDFSNLNATGTFDGVLPMIFDDAGGRIEGGRLTARPGGGGIAYVGDLTQKDLGFWGNLAFQSLKSLRYRNLDIRMNGPLAGEMVTDVRFAGVSQGAGAKSNFLIRRLQKLPFVFNIRIKAPFRGLIDSAQSFYDPHRLIQRNLPTLLREQNRRTAPSIQPPASETVP